jgi:hypothetical protein
MGILLLTSTGTSGDLDARKHHKRHRRGNDTAVVTVIDRTRWGAVNAETVADFQQIGVRVRYVTDSGGCKPVPGAVVLCEAPLDPGHLAEATVGMPRGGAFVKYNTLHPNPSENTACHEMMHVLAAVGDAYGTDPASCVWGSTLGDPGPTDRDLLRRAGRIP